MPASLRQRSIALSGLLVLLLLTWTPGAALQPPASIVLNEYLPAPDGTDWNGDGRADAADEWVELINVGQELVVLEGWQLDDGPGGGAALTLGANVQLGPGELLVVYLRRALLNNGGDRLQLLAPDGRLVDETSFTSIPPDQSSGRLPDGSGPWAVASLPTPGQLNQPAPSPTSTASLATAIAPTSTPGLTPGVLPTATATTTPTATCEVPPTLTLSATLTPTSTDTATPTWTASPTAVVVITLSPTLAAPPIPTPTFTATATATPQPTATATPQPTATATPQPTVTVTSSPSPAPSPDLTLVLLNEYLPAPDGTDWNGDGSANGADEWVELINVGQELAVLEGWQLDDGPGGGAALTLGPQAQLGPGELLVVYLGRALLNNGGDRLLLLAPDGTLVDETSFVSPPPDLSISRLPDGEGAWVSGTPPSPAAPNLEPAPTETVPAATPSLTPSPLPSATLLPSATPTQTPSAVPTQTPTRAPTLTPTRVTPIATPASPAPTATPRRLPGPTVTSIPAPTAQAAATAVPAQPAATATLPGSGQQVLPAGSPAMTMIRLNEYLPAPDGTDWNGDGSADGADEWVEIINVGQELAVLEGWQLDDGPGGGAALTLGPQAQLGPGELLVVYLGRALLNNGGDRLLLLAPGGTLVDETSFSAAGADLSLSRLPDGSGPWSAGTPATPGALNQAPLLGLEPPPDAAVSAVEGAGGQLFSTSLPAQLPAIEQHTATLPAATLRRTADQRVTPVYQPLEHARVQPSVGVLLPASADQPVATPVLPQPGEAPVLPQHASAPALPELASAPAPSATTPPQLLAVHEDGQRTAGRWLPLLLLAIAGVALGLELADSARQGAGTEPQG